MKIKKKTKKKIKNIIISLLVIILIGLITAFVYFVIYVFPYQDRVTMYKSDDKFFWAEFFYVESVSEIKDAPNAVLLSDSLLNLDESASLLKTISEQKNIDRIFVIAEKISLKEEKNIYLCKNCNFFDIKGRINIDREYLKILSDLAFVLRNDSVFQVENSLYLILPLIGHFFPQADVVPILVGKEVENDSLVRFRNKVKDSHGENSLIVGLSSFSDDNNLSLRKVDDISSRRTIQNFDIERLKSRSVSASSALATLLHLAQMKNLENVTFNNSYTLFYEGEKIISPGISMILFGNVPKDSGFGILSDFVYDRKYDARNDFTSFRKLRDIRGLRDSFLVGQDLLVFDKVENECERFLRNQFRLSICKIQESDEEKSVLTIQNEKEFSDLILALIEYSDGEFNDNKKSFAKKIADNGADILVGRGINEILPAELYKKSIIFYSLGDFMPKTTFFSELRMNLEGVVLALDISDTKISVYVIGVDVSSEFPKVSGVEELSRCFKKLSSTLSSNESFRVELNSDEKNINFFRKDKDL